MTKRYRALNSLYLTTSIWVNDIESVIEFKGGRNKPKRICGHFTTNNPLLQRAIEDSPSYGRAFILESPIEQAQVAGQKKGRSKKVVQHHLQPIDTIKTEQMALEWLRMELEIDTSKLKSKKLIEQCANKHGFTFTYLTSN